MRRESNDLSIEPHAFPLPFPLPTGYTAVGSALGAKSRLTLTLALALDW